MNGTRLASHILRIFWTEGGTIRLHLLFRAQSLLSHWLASPYHAFSPPLSPIFATCSVLNCQQTSFLEVHLPTKLAVGVTHSKALFSFSPFIVGPCDSHSFQIGRLRQDFAQDYAVPVQLTITTFPKTNRSSGGKILPHQYRSFLDRSSRLETKAVIETSELWRLVQAAFLR